METIMTIPKFEIIWYKTKASHPEKDFWTFIDSLKWKLNDDSSDG